MKCQSCGADTTADSLFCHRCGVRLPHHEGDHVSAPAFEHHEVKPLAGHAEVAPPADAGGQPAGRDDVVRKVAAGGRDIPEQDVWQGGFSSRAMLGSWIMAGLATVLLIVVGFYFWRTDVWLGVLATILMVWIFLGSRL